MVVYNTQIKKILKRQGLTQTGIAEELGLPISTFKKQLIVNNVSLAQLAKMCDILAVEPNVFFELDFISVSEKDLDKRTDDTAVMFQKRLTEKDDYIQLLKEKVENLQSDK